MFCKRSFQISLHTKSFTNFENSYSFFEVSSVFPSTISDFRLDSGTDVYTMITMLLFTNEIRNMIDFRNKTLGACKFFVVGCQI